jgi:hypothetical protein
VDRAKQSGHLREVEESIAKSRRHIARQQEIITELEADGHDISPMRRLLETLESVQRQHLHTRMAIRNELAD